VTVVELDSAQVLLAPPAGPGGAWLPDTFAQ